MAKVEWGLETSCIRIFNIPVVLTYQCLFFLCVALAVLLKAIASRVLTS